MNKPIFLTACKDGFYVTNNDCPSHAIGASPYEAVGRLICSFPDVFGVKIQASKNALKKLRQTGKGMTCFDPTAINDSLLVYPEATPLGQELRDEYPEIHHRLKKTKASDQVL